MHSLENRARVGGQQRQNLPGRGAIDVFTTSQSTGRCWHHKGIVSSAREYYYSQFLPKRKKREGERLKSLRHSEAESGEREASMGNFKSKRLGPGRLFSPWKINLHLILLRNCSSQKQIESMCFIFF